MTGGLIQLVTTGIQDSPLIGNPEVTFFKTVYKQHTMFSLCQNDRYLGALDFGRNATKVLEKNGDLLYNQYFRIEIPYFDIVKTISTITKTDLGYNLNELSVTYMNTNCIVLYHNNVWYIVPEKLFNISQFQSNISKLTGDLTPLTSNLLPDYITLTELGSNVNLYQIKDNDISSLISVLRINSSFWEQLWLNNISTSTDFKMMNQMLTIKNAFGQLYYLLKNRIFNLYVLRDLFALNSNYMYYQYGLVDSNGNKIYDEYGNIIQQNEVERYYNYVTQGDTVIKLNTLFDIDATYKYCQLNFLNFNDYRDNCLQNNPLLFNLIFKLLFATPDLNFTFWKKYVVSTNNTVNKSILLDETHYMNEWQDNINKYVFQLFNSNNINNIIFEKLKSLYLIAEEKISNIFSNLNLDNPSDIYAKLKTFLTRYYLIPYQQINFNNYYMATKYESTNLTTMFNNDEYYFNSTNEATKYPDLITNINNLDNNEMNNMTPVDMVYIYNLITMDVINLLFQNNNVNKGFKSPIILWRNTITNRTYRKFLDEYNSVVKNGHMISPINDRKFTLYYSITPSNFFTLQEYKNSYYQMFYKSSWVGRLNLETNNFQKFIESIHKVEINNLFNTDFSTYAQKTFHNLSISNTYNYVYNGMMTNHIDIYKYYVFDPIVYDSINSYLYIKYDNYYDMNSTITLTIGGNPYTYNALTQEIRTNELNTNSIYLKFDLSNNIGMSANFVNLSTPVTITLNVTYKTYLPVVTFYKDSMIYNNIQSTRYNLLDKFSNNTVKTLNIVDTNNINIDIPINGSFNNLMLTINYLDTNYIIPPIIDTSMIIPTIAVTSNVVDAGMHRYAVTYLTAAGESEMSNILQINVGSNMIVSIIYMVTDNMNVFGINIYRTKVSGSSDANTFYFVGKLTIEDNIYYDDTSDASLGIDYNIDTYVKLSTLQKKNTKCTRVPIYLEKSNSSYSICNMDGSKYYLPTSYTPIKNIYIDEIKLNETLNESTFYNINGFIIFNDPNLYSSNYLYYLVNCYNIKDTVKLVLTYNVINMNKLTLKTVTTSTPSTLTAGTYKYMITIYNSLTTAETLPSPSSTIKINTGDYVKITDFTKYDPGDYDSWNIYRTDGTSDTFYYLNTVFGLETDVLDGSIDYTLSSSAYQQPYFNITKQIYKGSLDNPSEQPDLTDMNTDGNIAQGNYMYLYTYYNNNEESLNSTANTITTTTLTQVKITIPAVTVPNVTGVKIYRTKESSQFFYQIANITNITSTITFIDNTPDSNLSILVPKTYKILKVPNYSYILEKPNTPLTLEPVGTGNLTTGTYMYFYTYFTSKSYHDIESEKSPVTNINITNSMVRINIPISSNNDVTGRYIYRTQVGGTSFFLIGKLSDNITTSWIDNMTDSTLNVSYTEPLQNIVPNLNSFMSHSTDVNYANSKNMSDLNDYMFNKPFIMLLNNSNMNQFSNYDKLINSFDKDFVYFYNIGFKINETSVITLNGSNVNYMLPVSMQQYFIKESNDNYYMIDSNITQSEPSLTNSEKIDSSTILKSEPSQRTFNPAFDEFNLTQNFLSNSIYPFYYDAMIDSMIYMIDNILSNNADYNKIINTMESANNTYTNIFTSMINYNNTNLYGLTSQLILNCIDSINNLINISSSGTVNYPILNFNQSIAAPLPMPMQISNLDFLRYSHYALRLVNDTLVNDSKLVTFKNNILNVLSPVYNYYTSSKKVADNTYIYFNTISNLFINQISYVGNNIDYLNLSNPDNYNDKYLSYPEIIQETYNKFKDYSGTNTITPLYQLYDSGFYKIILNDKTLTNFSLDGNNIITTDYTQNIQSNNYNDTIISNVDRNLYRNNRFNYLGITSIDMNSNIIFNDMYINTPFSNTTYYKFDDNKIYTLTPNSNGNKYGITYELTDNMIINPYELVFNNSTNLQSLVLTKFSNNKYVYSYNLTFANTFSFVGSTNFIINNTIVNGTIINNNNIITFILILNSPLTFNENVLMYEATMGDKTSWQVSSQITNVSVNNFKIGNYYINNSLNGMGINSGDIYSLSDNYYDMSTISEINNTCYFNLPASDPTVTINLYNKVTSSSPANSYVTYNLKPSLIIRGGTIYSYYADGSFTRDILNTDPNYYILLIDTSVGRYFILKICDIKTKQIPKGNYHTYILPSYSVNTIEYNVTNISIDSNGNISGLAANNLPTYSFYMIGNVVYFYTTGDTINIVDSIAYFNQTNITSNMTIYLIDNTLFNTELKQMIGITMNFNLNENFITKKLNVDSQVSFDTLNYLVYNSRYSNTEFVAASYNSNTIQLLGDNEVIVEMLIQNTNMQTIYQPIVIKKYDTGIIIPSINFTYNLINYSKSFIPINSTNLFDSNNKLINNLVIGTINNTDTFTSISNNIIISNNEISLNKGYIVSNLAFELKLWKIKGVTSSGRVYYVYFWILFTNNTQLIQNYLDVLTDTTNNIGISEPLYLDTDSNLTIKNYCLQYNLISCYPNILQQSNKDLILLNNTYDTSIYYQFYTDTRHYNTTKYTHILKQLDYNNVVNIKPTVEFLANNLNSSVFFSSLQSSEPTVFNSAKYFIFVYQRVSTKNREYKVVFKSDVPNNLYFDYDGDISNVTTYYSLNYPIFINNTIVLIQNTSTIYQIVKFNNMFLEMNELIILDGNILIVNGLNLKSNTYTLTLITSVSTLKDKYNGYFTLGNFLRKDNKVLPEIDYETMLTYKPTFTPSVGDMYFSNSMNKFVIATSSSSVSDVSTFQESSLTIKLYYNMNGLFLFDNMILLKNFDRLLCTVDNNIYTIKNIRDGMIFLDTNMNLSSNYNNTFITFILPYQPFKIMYLNFDSNGNILSEKIPDNMTILLDDMDIYNVNNNMINIDNVANMTPGFRLVRVLNTNYISFFENVSYVPINTSSFNISNKYPIMLSVNYDHTNNRMKILNNSSIMTNFNFYYFQPIFISGTYNFIKNITFDGTNYWIVLMNSSNIVIDGIMKVTFSPSYTNNKEYYNQTKFRYNFGIQSYDYNNLIGKSIEVVRYILKDNKVILVQTKLNNNKIIFTYGVSIAINEERNKIKNVFINNKFKDNKDVYESIYFYGNFSLNSNSMINNYDTLLGSYHLICQMNQDFNKVNLCKIIYPNNMFAFQPFNYNYLSKSFLGRIICIKSNFLNEIVYSDFNMVQSKKVLEINNKSIKLIKKYDIRLIGTPTFINNVFNQEIQFIGGNTFSYELYNTIYLDESLTQAYSIITTNINSILHYYIVSSSYLSNKLKTIYTILTNYLDSATMSQVSKKNKKLADNDLDYYIDTKLVNTEILLFNINFSRISNTNSIYKYKYVLDDKLDHYKLNSNEKYFIQYVNQIASSINNNNNTIITTYPLDSDTLVSTHEYDRLKCFTIRTLDVNNIFDPTKMFTNVKALKISLFNNAKISDIDIFNKLKPWKVWALLNSILGVNRISSLLNNCYLQYSGNTVSKKTDALVNYSYLTNNEVTMLTTFLIDINTKPNALTNFNRMKNNITPLILSNLKNWLGNNWFFLNVTNNINSFLQGAGYNDVMFDGNNLIFNNMITPTIYISNEYTFDSVNNIVYRSIDSYNKINTNIFQFINNSNIAYNPNNYFGISIPQLLRHLRILGDQFIQLTTNFTNVLTSTPEYPYNNPLKFIINKVWENHMSDSELALLDKNFQQNETFVLRYTRNSNIYSSINYLINLDISYFGLYSTSDYNEFVSTINSQYNMTNLTQYKDTLLKPVQIINKLIINTLYPYKINFKTDEITGDASYSIDFLNGENIMTDYTITSPNTYPDELLFSSPINIKSSDFITVKKKKSYTVNNSTFMGYLYAITFNNLSLVDSIYFRNYSLTIMSINNNVINLLVPLSLIELGNITEINTTDIFEIRNNVSILSTKVINNNTYLTFLNSMLVLNNFVANKTLLRTPNNIYMLQVDNSNQFYITGSTLDSYDCIIINMMNPTNVVNMNQGIYNIILSSNIVNTGLSSYEPIDKNIIIPMDFKYKNSSNSLTPLKVNSVQDNIVQFYFNSNDINTINSSTGWNTVVNTKRIGHDLTNAISKLEKVADYAYYFNNIIPSTSSTVIFVYDTTNNDIDVINNVFEPINNTMQKTSMTVTHMNNITRFTLNTLLQYTDTTDKLSFIQKNFWTITNYNITDSMMTIKVPSDFIINTSNKYYYKINNIVINKGSFLYDGVNLTFNWNDSTTNGLVIFTQYYVETTVGMVMIPFNNMKVKITLDYPYQYTINDNFYILPYDSNGNEFNNYFYILKTSDTTNLNGFGMIGFTDGSSNYTDSSITLYQNGTIFNGNIFDEYYDGSSKYLIISLNNILDTSLSYTYSLADTIVKSVVSISFYQQLLFTGDTPYQNSSNYIYIYTNSNINSYIPLNGSSMANRFYLIGYSDYKLTNLYYNPTFVQNPNMMKQIVYNTSANTIIEKPRFKTYDKLFSFIRLYFNDQLMEELNEYVFNINYHLYSTEEQRRQFDKMVIIRNNSSYELYIPLIFWFSKKAGMSLPTIALPNTQLRLEYKINELANILDNNLSGSYRYSTNPTCKITLQSEFILLDSMERKLFGSFSHEYVIDRYINAPYNNITNDTTVLVKNWSGLIKDIHFIAEPENYSGLNYFPEITNDYDYQYQRYVTAVKYYNLYQATNYFTSAEQREYNLDINIISQNTIDLNNYILTHGRDSNTRIQKYIDFFSRWSIWDSSYELLKFILYYDDKYISFVPEDQKIYSITIYLSYLYSNKMTVREVSPVQSMLIRVNGSDLFAERDWNYYTNVIPYQKFKNTLPTGYYTYTFSLHPTDDQHSGHLNFSFFDDVVVKVKSNMMKPDGTTYGSYKLNTVLKEYNILRIMSGMGNLAWIN
jgi:hypothetical protein